MCIKAFRWLAFIAAALSIVYFVYHIGHNSGYSKADAEKQRYMHEIARERLAAQDQAHRIEIDKNRQISQITTNYHRILKDEKQKNESIIGDYKRGNIRLRERFKAAAILSEADSALGDSREKTCGLQDTDVGFLIRFAERADETAAQLTACQGVLRSAVQY
jgi:hypothetical protein